MPLSIVWTLLPKEEATLRRVKQGIDLPGEDPVYRATVDSARANGRWILYDCHDVSATARTLISLRKNRDGRIFFTNLPGTEVPHVDGCIFAPGDEARRRMSAIVFRDVLYPIAADRERPDEERPGKGSQRWLARPGSGRWNPTLTGHLHGLMQAGSLHRLSVADGFASPEEWLAGIARAAGIFRSHGVRSFWSRTRTNGHRAISQGAMDEIEPLWPKKGPPFVWQCWIARDLDGREVNGAHPALGHVRVLSDVVCPTAGGNRAGGP